MVHFVAFLGLIVFYTLWSKFLAYKFGLEKAKIFIEVWVSDI